MGIDYLNTPLFSPYTSPLESLVSVFLGSNEHSDRETIASENIIVFGFKFKEKEDGYKVYL